MIATRLVKIKTIMVSTLPLFYPDKNIFPFGGFQETKKTVKSKQEVGHFLEKIMAENADRCKL